MPAEDRASRQIQPFRTLPQFGGCKLMFYSESTQRDLTPARAECKMSLRILRGRVFDAIAPASSLRSGAVYWEASVFRGLPP
jgi:hypothetical protein